jgi:site-specific recombinase XerD
MVPKSTPSIIERAPCEALTPFIGSYIAEVTAQGYAPVSIRYQVSVLFALGQWVQRTGRKPADVSEQVVAVFLRQYQKSNWAHVGAPAALRRFVEMLRRLGVVAPVAEAPRTPAQKLVQEYEQFLSRDRALSCQTVQAWTPYVIRFLRETFGKRHLALRALRPAHVTKFMRRHACRFGSSYRRKLVASLRSFLRYLHHRGKTEYDLSVAVLAVARWSLSSVPKHLPASEVKKLLASCDRRTALGRRNYAILLLLARLGLRAGEVVNLHLGDIDWDSGHIAIRGKGGRHAQLPLPADVGRAVANYLKRDRPSCACRRVFIRDHAPIRGLTRATAIAKVVYCALQRAGVASVHKGAHLLRHSLATEMLRKGASLDEIGEVLRHRSPDTTAIYAKVDMNALRPLALAWPGGGK